jgi:hypothetical protein
MKTPIRTLIIGLALAAATSFITLDAQAQKAGVYALSLNATNQIAATSTNSFVTLNGTQLATNGLFLTCSEFDYVGASLSAQGSGADTGTLIVRLSKSMNGGVTFESTPSLSVTLTKNGTNVVCVNSYLDCHGVTTLAVNAVEHLGTTTATNVQFSLNLKANKVGARQATQ